MEVLLANNLCFFGSRWILVYSMCILDVLLVCTFDSKLTAVWAN